MQKLQPHRWFAAFFAFGATMCTLTIALLLFSGTALDSLWRLNPDAHLPIFVGGALIVIGGLLVTF